MDIYFVRHGQTDGNVARRHQHTNIALNEVGKRQAALVANRIKQLKPTHLISSTNVRALETARHIGLACDLIPETYPAFEELRRPVFLIGERFSAKSSLLYVLGWFFAVPSASMHDGESYTDFRSRLSLARTHLATLPKDARVVIVSHSVFINFFFEHMNHPDRMRLTSAASRFIKILRLHNTTITHVRYDEARKPAWHILRHL